MPAAVTVPALEGILEEVSEFDGPHKGLDFKLFCHQVGPEVRIAFAVDPDVHEDGVIKAEALQYAVNELINLQGQGLFWDCLKSTFSSTVTTSVSSTATSTVSTTATSSGGTTVTSSNRNRNRTARAT